MRVGRRRETKMRSTSTPGSCKIELYPAEVAAKGSVSDTITVDVPLQRGFGANRPARGRSSTASRASPSAATETRSHLRRRRRDGRVRLHARALEVARTRTRGRRAAAAPRVLTPSTEGAYRAAPAAVGAHDPPGRPEPQVFRHRRRDEHCERQREHPHGVEIAGGD